MHVLRKANQRVQSSRLLTTLVGSLLIFIFGIAVLNIYTDLRQNREEDAFKNAPRIEFFNYVDVSYIGSSPSGLLFESTREIYKAIPVRWVDKLNCKVGEDFVQVGRQVFEGTLSPEDPEVGRWTYAEPYPLDELCYMISDIEGEGGKTQRIVGKVFRTPKE